MWDPIHVVQVVQDSVVRAPPKDHAPLTITVNSGLLWSVENADHAASISKGAGRGVRVSAVPFFCQGEGRGFESRRPLQRKSRSEWYSGTKSRPPRGQPYHIRTTFFEVLWPSHR
jgi:hypothetical protein